jgi:hypothetical protein
MRANLYRPERKVLEPLPGRRPVVARNLTFEDRRQNLAYRFFGRSGRTRTTRVESSNLSIQLEDGGNDPTDYRSIRSRPSSRLQRQSNSLWLGGRPIAWVTQLLSRLIN